MVVKIVDIEGMETSNMSKFMTVIRNNRNNPHFPRVSFTKSTHYKGRDVYIIIMEKLHPMNSEKLGDVSLQQFENNMGLTIDTVVRQYALATADDSQDDNEERVKTYIEDMEIKSVKQVLHLMGLSLSYDPLNLEFFKSKSKNKLFWDAMEVLMNAGLGHHFDTHDENFMIRLTGSGPVIVITDPVMNE